MALPSLSEQMWIEPRGENRRCKATARVERGGELKAARLTRGLPVAMLSVALPITSVQ